MGLGVTKAGNTRQEKQAVVKMKLTWSLTFPSQQQPHMMSYVCRHHHVTTDYTSTAATQEKEKKSAVMKTISESPSVLMMTLKSCVSSVVSFRKLYTVALT